ncbi:MAG: biopolymer transporter ExbD [Betaproteobacteria bacterium]|jgi:biopolymer transport protein ExbD|nr:biopolymer transporter ExbD [Betaproteobacteria bacterium]
MAMHLGPSDGDDELLTSINTTPLVDVMLVLLIIFLITIPVVTTSVKVDLPREVQQPRETKPDNIILSVNARGQAFLFDTPLRNQAEMVKQLQTLADKKPQPEVQIRGDAQTDYEAVGRVLFAAQSVGLTKVRFVTDPQAK